MSKRSIFERDYAGEMVPTSDPEYGALIADIMPCMTKAAELNNGPNEKCLEHYVVS